jgi:hypothetical protein
MIWRHFAFPARNKSERIPSFLHLVELRRDLGLPEGIVKACTQTIHVSA